MGGPDRKEPSIVGRRSVLPDRNERFAASARSFIQEACNALPRLPIVRAPSQGVPETGRSCGGGLRRKFRFTVLTNFETAV